MNTVRLFDAYADTYHVKFNENPIAIYQREQVYGIIKPFLRAESKLLDIGCGPGSDFAFYKSHKLIVDAIDISPRMVQLAKEYSEKINFNARIIHSSLQDFVPETTYDTIVMNFGVINVFDNLCSILKKLAALLNRDGVLLIVSMAPFHFFFIFELLVRLKFATTMRRLIKHQAVLENGFEIFYYRYNDFSTHFNLVKKRNLGPLLPTPDQYNNWAWARAFTKAMLKTDQTISGRLPEILGGDHVCYVLKKMLTLDQ